MKHEFKDGEVILVKDNIEYNIARKLLHIQGYTWCDGRKLVDICSSDWSMLVHDIDNVIALHCYCLNSKPTQKHVAYSLFKNKNEVREKGYLTFDDIPECDVVECLSFDLSDIDVVKTIGDMCSKYQGKCHKCPLYDKDLDCKHFMSNEPVKALKIITEYRTTQNIICDILEFCKEKSYDKAIELLEKHDIERNVIEWSRNIKEN